MGCTLFACDRHKYDLSVRGLFDSTWGEMFTVYRTVTLWGPVVMYASKLVNITLLWQNKAFCTTLWPVHQTFLAGSVSKFSPRHVWVRHFASEMIMITTETSAHEFNVHQDVKLVAMSLHVLKGVSLRLWAKCWVHCVRRFTALHSQQSSLEHPRELL